MARPSRARLQHRSARPGWRDRHGRGIRAWVTGPYLPPLRHRDEEFEALVAHALHHLQDSWPEELSGARFDIAPMPPSAGPDGIRRFSVDRAANRVTYYRTPIERLGHQHEDDEVQRRSIIESQVIRGVAELMGRDPWDISPERYRHY